MAINGEPRVIRTRSSVRKTNLPLIKTEPVERGIDICISSAEEQIDTNCETKLKVLKNETENEPIKSSVIKIEPVEIGVDNIYNSSVQQEVDTNCKIKLKDLDNVAGNVPIISSTIKTEPVEIGIDDIWNSSDEDDTDTKFKRQQNIFNHETENVPINNIIESKQDCSNKSNEVEGENENCEDITIVGNLASDEQLVVNYGENLGSIRNNTSKKSIDRDQINWAAAYKTSDPDWEEESKKIIRYCPPKITQIIAPHELTTLSRNKHVCNYCQYTSKDIRAVREHIRFNHREDVATYQCPYCPYKLKANQDSLRSHIIAKHKDEKDIRWFECFLCNMKFKLKARMSIHIRRMHFPSNDWKSCPICEKKYKDSACLNSHMTRFHKKKKQINYFCKQCDSSFKQQMSLNHHVEVWHTNLHELPTHKCKHCDYKTKYELRFRRHSKLHKRPFEMAGRGGYTAPVCIVEEGGSDALNEDEIRRELTRFVDLVFGNSLHCIHYCAKFIRLACEKCGFLATNVEGLRLHQMTHKKQIDESEFKYRCTKCDYKTYRLFSFNVHKLNHLEPHEIQYFYCYHCGFKAKRKDNLKTHVLRHFKKDEVTFQCFICDFLTKKRHLLINHIKKHSEAQNQDQVYS